MPEHTLSHGRYTVENIRFDSHGSALAGNLYLPLADQRAAPAVVLLGPYCYVKEQAPIQYATRLADEGFVALAFDARRHGESEGEPRRLELPLDKVADARAALDYLVTRPEVDGSRLAVLGVCEGASEMLQVAVEDDRVGAVATVSGHYRDHDNDIALMGGMELMTGEITRDEVEARFEARLARAVAARTRYESTDEVEYAPIVDPVRTDVALSGKMIWDWYHGWADRGIWENRYAIMGDVEYFAYESVTAASRLTKPHLMIHGDYSAGPESARRHQEVVPADKQRLIWEDGVNHFQYYEDPATIDRAVGNIATWFYEHLS